MKFVIFSLSIFVLFFVPSIAFGEIQSITTDKTSYTENETIKFSGKAEYNEDNPVLITRVLNPSESDFVFLDQLILPPSGNFKVDIVTGGPKWSEEGPYKILVTYAGTTKEKTIQFKLGSMPDDSTVPKETPKPKPQTIPEHKDESEKLITKTKENLKNRVPGFPSLDKSPQYYFQRYDTEEDYRKWFDSQFPNHTIEEVVGYPETHIPNFPDDSNFPMYYIQRYQTEPNYKDWFDSHFPDESIYSVLGFPDKRQVPAWIKHNAGWWSGGQIDDRTFVQGLQYMIANKIIILDDIQQSSVSESEIPSWIRNVAEWWSNDQISEHEFVQSLRYLIEQGIVVVPPL